MADSEFKKVKLIRKKDKDIVYGYIKRMQLMFPDDNPFFIIVQLIQDIVLLYFHAVIDSKILSDNEQTTLYEMVNNHTNNEFTDDWKLLYRGTRDGYKRNEFYKKCHLKKNTICIIETLQNNVFGGYTSCEWNESKQNWEHERDPFAFLYLLRSKGTLNPKLFPVQNNGSHAIQHYQDGYLSFGPYGEEFFIAEDYDAEGRQCVDIYVSDHETKTYNLPPLVLVDNEFDAIQPTEIEVFQLENCSTL